MRGLLFGLGLLSLALSVCHVYQVKAQVYTETFYVCEGGDGTLPEIATCATAWDAADFNTAGNWDTDDEDDGKIGPNDIVYFMDAGGKIRGYPQTQQQGLSGKPIIISAEAGGAPVVSGSDLITGWEVYGTEPDDVANLHVWYEADSLALNDNDPVASWTDLSGNNFHATQGTEANKPTYKTDIINGHNVVRFVDQSDHLTNAMTSISQPNTLFMVIDPDGGSGVFRHILGSPFASRTGLRLSSASPPNLALLAPTTDCSYSFNTSGFVVLTGLYNGLASTIREDGVQKGAGDVGAHAWSDLWIGRSYIGSDGMVNGDIAEIIIYDANVSAADRDAIENYLGVKYGLFGSGNTYKKTGITAEPKQVFLEGSPATKGVDQDSLNDHEWFWIADVLYFRDDSGDPDVTGATIEASQRDYGFKLAHSYVTLNGLKIEHANKNGLYVGIGVITYPTVSDCTITYNYEEGVYLNGSSVVDYGTIKNSTITYNGSHGILGNDNIEHWTFSGNTISYNGRILSHAFSGGIKIWGNDIHAKNNVIEKNVVQNNAVGSASGARGCGIWLDGVGGTSGNENIIRYNLVSGNASSGIFIEHTNYTKVYYNIVYDNADVDWTGNIQIKASFGLTSSNNEFYNNLSYGSRFLGINCGVIDTGVDPQISNNTWKNNIITESEATAEVRLETGCGNDGVYGSGNVYEYNSFGLEAAGFIFWNGAGYNTYDAWLAVSEQSDTNVESDPLFTAPGSSDFTLQPGSPAINAGTDVGLGGQLDIAGHYIPTVPGAVDIGAYEAQYARRYWNTRRNRR